MKENKPLISIVTVTYNAEKYLEKTIKSVIAQNYKNIEYIIIDGKSTDNTIAIIKKYEKYVSFWISEKDNGIYDAMNKGINKASGDWINFMNAGDSLYASNTITLLTKNLEKNLDILCGDIIVVDDNLNKQNYLKAKGIETIWEYPPCWHQSMLIKTSWHKSNLYNLRYKTCADYNFMIESYISKKIFKFIDIPVCYFLDGGISTSSVYNNRLEGIVITSKHIPIPLEIKNNFFYKDSINHYRNQALGKLDLYTDINKIIKNLKEFKNKYKKIAIYGHGNLGQLVSSFLKEKLVLIIDKDHKKIITNLDTCNIENIHQYDFDCILITLIGREDLIITELITKYNIQKERIHTLI